MAAHLLDIKDLGLYLTSRVWFVMLCQVVGIVSLRDFHGGLGPIRTHSSLILRH